VREALANSASSARPAWTTRALWGRSRSGQLRRPYSRAGVLARAEPPEAKSSGRWRRDYYAVLGVVATRRQDEIKKAYRRLARELHPDVNPDPETQERFKEITAAYEVLSDPQKRQVYDIGGDPLSNNGGGFGAAASAASAATSWTRSSAAAAARAAHPHPPRPGRDDPGGDRPATRPPSAPPDIQVDTAVVCPTCTGDGAAAGTQPTPATCASGRGEVSQVTRSFLGQVMTSRPCPQCQGYGTVVPAPVPGVRVATAGSGPGARSLSRIPPGVDNGTRIKLTGEGEVGPGGGSRR
jgi:molecular chaperone DnaJ